MYFYLHYPPFLSDILFIYTPQDLSDTTIADSQVASSKSVLRSSYFYEGLNKRKNIYFYSFFGRKLSYRLQKWLIF